MEVKLVVLLVPPETPVGCPLLLSVLQGVCNTLEKKGLKLLYIERGERGGGEGLPLFQAVLGIVGGVLFLVPAIGIEEGLVSVMCVEWIKVT